MQPTITREAIIDRRRPAVRWSAVLAGAAVAVGLWGVLQLLGVGAGLAAIDPDDLESARDAVLGIGVWSVLAPLIAMFVGGFLAAWLARTFDRKTGIAHAVVVWGLTALAGLLTSMWMVSVAAHGMSRVERPMGGPMMGGPMMGGAPMGPAMGGPQMGGPMTMGPPPVQGRGYGARGMHREANLIAEAQDALVPINQRLRQQNKAELTADQLIAAVREASDNGRLARDELIEHLDESTALSREDATEVVNQLGPRVHRLARRASASHPGLAAAERTGTGLLTLGVSILLGSVTAVLGALLALRFGRKREAPGERPYPTSVGPAPVITPPPPTSPLAWLRYGTAQLRCAVPVRTPKASGSRS